MPNNDGIKFINPVTVTGKTVESEDVASSKNIVDSQVDKSLGQHMIEKHHVTSDDKAKWDSAINKRTEIIAGQEDVVGFISYDKDGLILSIDPTGIESVYPEVPMSNVIGLAEALEQLVPATENQAFIFDIATNEDGIVGSMDENGLKIEYKKLDTNGTESTVFITIPKVNDTHAGLMTKELYVILAAIDQKISDINGKLTILPSYDFGKADPTEEDFQTYINHLQSLGVTVTLKQGLTVFNIFDNVEWTYDETAAKWVKDGDAIVGIATAKTPGLFKTNSEDEFGIAVDPATGKIIQNGLSVISDALNKLVDSLPHGEGDTAITPVNDAFYQSEINDDFIGIKPSTITKENVVIDNPNIPVGHLLKLTVDKDTGLPTIDDSSLTIEGIEVPVLKPIFVNESNIATELRNNVTTTNKYYARYICYHGCKYGMVSFYVASNNAVTASGILSDKDRSYTFTYNSAYMTKPTIIPIGLASTNLDNNNLCVTWTESGFDINKCIAFYVLKNGTKIGMIDSTEFNILVCNQKTETEMMDAHGYRFCKNDIIAFFFTDLFTESTIEANFLANVKTLQNIITIPASVTMVKEGFLNNSGVVRLDFLNPSFKIPDDKIFCCGCDDLQEITLPFSGYSNIILNGIDTRFLYGTDRSISWERGIRLASTVESDCVNPDAGISVVDEATGEDIPTTGGEEVTPDPFVRGYITLDKVLRIVSKLPNNDHRHIVIDTMVVLTVNDKEVAVTANDISQICNNSSADTNITIGNDTFQKSSVTKARFGRRWNLTKIPNDFLRNFTGLTEIGELPLCVTEVGDRFLYGCVSFNQDMKLHEGIISLGDSFLDDCAAFASTITLPSTLESIGTDFMSSCGKYTHAMRIPSSVMSIGAAFMFSCYKFTGPLHVTNNFVNAINPVMALESDTTEADMYTDGVKIYGLTSDQMSALLGKIPNSDTSDPTSDVYYRNIFSDDYLLRLTLNDNSTVDINTAEQLALCCTVDAATGSITITESEDVSKTFTKDQVVSAEFGPAWNLTATPVNFLMHFTSLTTINELPGTLTSIGMNFLNDCPAFNAELIIPETVAAIGNGFLTSGTAFNSKLVLPSNLTTIGDSFLGMCANFNQSLTIPSTVTSIGTAFMWDCYQFNSDLFVSANFIEAINPLNAMISSQADVPLFTDGITIVGLNEAQFAQLLVKVPNTNDGVNYRNIKSVYENGVFEIILIANDNRIVKIDRDSDEDMALISGSYATPDDVIKDGVTRKDIVKILFGEWDHVPASKQNFPDKFLFNFSNLNMVDEVPSTLLEIGHLAFYGCNALNEIVLPAHIHLNGSAFAYNCDKLNVLRAPDDTFENVQYREIDDIRTLANDTIVATRYNNGIGFVNNIKNELKAIYAESDQFPFRQYARAAIRVLTSTGTSYEFMMDRVSDLCNHTSASDTIVPADQESFQLTAITQVEFLAGWTSSSIPDGFMQSFTNLVNVAPLPAAITSIGDNFLSGCTSFNQELILSEKIKRIGNGFLSGCTSYNQAIILPSAITSIGDNFLSSASAFASNVTIPATVSSIGSNYLASTAFNSPITLGANVRSIGENFLMNCNNMHSTVDMSASKLSEIKSHFLYGCSLFDHPITIPETVKSIGEYFMGSCMAFSQSIAIPASVISVANGFMNECRAFGMLNVTSNFVNAIQSSDLHLSSTLNTATLYNPGVFVFGLTTTEFDALVAKIPTRTSSPYRKLQSPETGSMVSYFKADGSYVYALNETQLLSTCTEGEDTEQLTLNGVTFAKNEIVKAKFGTGYTLTSIPDNFLMNFSALTEVGTASGATLPTSVKTIGNNFMRGCTSYTGEITVPNTITASNGSIGTGFMHNCSQFNTLNVSSNFVNAITNLDYLTLSVDENHVGENLDAPMYSPGIVINGLTSAEFNNLVSATKLPNMAGEEH